MMKISKVPSLPFFTIDQYEIIDTIAHTYAGPVKHVKNRDDNNDYLMFCINNEYPELYEEIQRVYDLDEHTGILKIFGMIKAQDDLNISASIITEYAPNGCLENKVHSIKYENRGNFLSKLHIACLLFACANAFRIIHAHGISFKYFSLSSIYLSEQNDFKMANPGVTAFFNPDIYYSEKIKEQLFIAPEVFEEKQSSIYSDIYAYGSLMFQFYCRQVKFPKNCVGKTFSEKILSGIRPIYPNNMPLLVKTTVSQCWAQEPSERPNFREIMTSMIKHYEFFFSLSNPSNFVSFQKTVLSATVLQALSITILNSKDNRSSTYISTENESFSMNNQSFPSGNLRISLSQSDMLLCDIDPNDIYELTKRGKLYARKVMDLQNILMNLNTNNLFKTKKILAVEYAQESSKDIIRHFFTAVTCRYKYIKLYATVLKYIHKNCNQFTNYKRSFLILLEEYLIQGDCFPRDIPKICLFSWCKILGMFSSEEVVRFVSKIYITYQDTQKKTLCLLFAWFAPEIQVHDTELYDKLYDILVEIQNYPTIPFAYKHFYSNFSEYSKDGWKILKTKVEDNFKNEKTSDFRYFLRNDNLFALKMLFIDNKISLHTRVSSDIYCPCIYVHDSPTILMYAAAYGAEKCFQFLQMKGASLCGRDDKYRTLSTFAILGGNITIVRFAQNTNDHFDSSLQVATTVHRNKLFIHLLKWKSFDLEEPDKFDKKIITTAAAANNMYIFIYCLIHQVQLDSHETFGWTSLHAAAERGNLDIIKIIMKYQKCDPNVKDTWGSTPLHLAAEKLHINVVSYLLNKKEIDVNAKNEKNKTPFLIASKTCYLPLLRAFLLCNRVNFQVCSSKVFFNIYNETALHLAVKSGHVEVVKELLKSQTQNTEKVNNENVNQLFFILLLMNLL